MEQIPRDKTLYTVCLYSVYIQNHTRYRETQNISNPNRGRLYKNTWLASKQALRCLRTDIQIIISARVPPELVEKRIASPA